MSSPAPLQLLLLQGCDRVVSGIDWLLPRTNCEGHSSKNERVGAKSPLQSASLDCAVAYCIYLLQKLTVPADSEATAAAAAAAASALHSAATSWRGADERSLLSARKVCSHQKHFFPLFVCGLSKAD